MDVSSLVSAFIGAQMGQTQTAVAAKMLRMDAANARAVVELLEAGQQNLNRLTNVAAGVGGTLDVSA